MTDLSIKIEDVTPAKAARWLEKNPSNRNLSKSNVREYAHAMKRGDWLSNGETIKFDVDDNLLDGQHRLQAIIVADLTLPMAIVRGLENKTFQTIDTGKARTGGDLFSTRGIKSANDVAAAARLIFFYELDPSKTTWGNSAQRRSRCSNPELVDLLDRHPQLPAIAVEGVSKPYAVKAVARSACMFLYYMGNHIDRDSVQSFFRQLSNGRFDDDADAVYILRERIIQTNAEVIKPTGKVKLAWLITAWNHYYNGTELKRLPRDMLIAPRLCPGPKFGA